MRNTSLRNPDLIELGKRSAITIRATKQRIEETRELLRRSKEIVRRSEELLSSEILKRSVRSEP